jgi:hypothetical protein
MLLEQKLNGTNGLSSKKMLKNGINGHTNGLNGHINGLNGNH